MKPRSAELSLSLHQGLFSRSFFTSFLPFIPALAHILTPAFYRGRDDLFRSWSCLSCRPISSVISFFLSLQSLIPAKVALAGGTLSSSSSPLSHFNLNATCWLTDVDWTFICCSESCQGIAVMYCYFSMWLHCIQGSVWCTVNNLNTTSTHFNSAQNHTVHDT